MTYALIFLGCLMAVVVWWLVRQTVNVTPWVERRAGDNLTADGALSLPPVKVGLGVFLAVATSLFALLISAYHMRMMGTGWVRLPLPRVLWANTVVLVLAQRRDAVDARRGEKKRAGAREARHDRGERVDFGLSRRAGLGVATDGLRGVFARGQSRLSSSFFSPPCMDCISSAVCGFR